MSQQYPFTEEEIRVIAQLKRAFTKANKLGLKFSGMDSDLYVCNNRVFHEMTKLRQEKLKNNQSPPYNQVAMAINERQSGADILVLGMPYVDSGGW